MVLLSIKYLSNQVLNKIKLWLEFHHERGVYTLSMTKVWLMYDYCKYEINNNNNVWLMYEVINDL